MAMLHPKFNHLGRSAKKRRKVSKKQEQANLEHEAFLAKHGLKPIGKRHRLKGAVIEENPRLIRRPDLPPTGDHIGGWAAKRVLR